MPKKCESCLHFDLAGKKHFDDGLCVAKPVLKELGYKYAMAINKARSICDREHNGHFVHFEPRDPASGAAFSTGPQASPPAAANG